ncbi:MAG: DUF805 domain-containing protein [Rhizobacter sp.]
MEGGAQVRLVFAGEILEGFQRDDVKRRFGEAFKLDETRLAAMFSGGRTVLKRSLAQADAVRYVAQLKKIGARIHVEPLEAAQPAAAAAPTAAAPPPAMAAPALVPLEEQITCPNCGERQPKRVLCRACSTDMPRGIEAKKEDADRARAERLAASRSGRWSPPASASGEVFSEDLVDPPPILGLSFEGRMGRITYFNAGAVAWAALAAIGVVAAVLVPATRSVLAFIPLVLGFFVFFIWSLRVTVLRLHDLNLSGWWVLLNVIPLVLAVSLPSVSALSWLGMLALLFVPGSAAENNHGPKPRQGNGLIAIVVAVVLVIGMVAVGRISMSAYDGYRKRSIRASQAQQADAAPGVSQRPDDYLHSPAAVEAFAQYAAEPKAKAFATSSNGAFGWRAGQGSLRDAATKAVAACDAERKAYTSACRVVNVDGYWVQQR